MDVFQSYFGLLYRIIVYILFSKLEACWDKMQFDGRCMEKY